VAGQKTAEVAAALALSVGRVRKWRACPRCGTAGRSASRADPASEPGPADDGCGDCREAGPGALDPVALARAGGARPPAQIDPPRQNACIARFNRTVRHEWLGQYIVETIEEAQGFATQWLWTYNNERPNRGIDGITPARKLKMVA
jgi:hypothetical protein